MYYEKRNFEKKSYEKRGLTVMVIDNNVDKALSKLKNLLNKEGVLKDAKKHQFFESQSEKKKRRKAEAVKKQRKLDRRNAQYWG